MKVHVKVDTGMGRLGFAMHEVNDLAKRLARLKHVEVEGVMSHFASSERRDDQGFKQIEAFRLVLDTLRASGIEPEFAHMANSGAICNYPEAHFSMVRPGIVLYGSYPDVHSSKQDKPETSDEVVFPRRFCPAASLRAFRSATGEPT